MSSENVKKVFVAMSGGVDSSVAALLLKNEGYEVTGVFMRCVSPSTALRADCTTEVDATDARRVAEKVRIPFYVWDFEEEYKRRVVDYMIDGYRRGETPNPDVMCNREIKFGIFFERAMRMGADYVATGHYVRLRRTQLTVDNKQLTADKKFVGQMSNVRCQMFSARDAQKDQSYFLWTLTQEKLRHCLFPIGDYLKQEVREMARKAGLPTADKKDSQGICFLGKITLADFLKQYIPEKTGDVLLALSDVEGNLTYKKIGKHAGAHFYTIGQRHLGVRGQVSGIRGRHETPPFYVAEKNVATNTLTVAEGNNHPSLHKKEVELSDMNFIQPVNALIRANVRIRDNEVKVLARVRYRQPLAKATLRFQGTAPFDPFDLLRVAPRNSRGDQLRVRLIFDQPQKFVASGQSAVFYSAKSEMLGGGIIL